MEAYVTSIGERTTQICCDELKRLGFEVILLGDRESWINKYSKFIKSANEDCFRIDADVIPNSKMLLAPDLKKDAWAIRSWVWDLYKNDLSITGPVFYRKQALDIIRENLDKLNPNRPEATALRLPEVNPHIFLADLILGIHGLQQSDETIERARKHKIERGHLKKYNYNFDLVRKLKELGW